MADGKKDTALGLGERLRSARKARALSLEQAAQTLRLPDAVLRSLEDERFDTLGAAVFVRGHLKAYARLLGLSEDAVMAAYRAADPAADAPPKVAREREKPLNASPGPLAVGAWIGIALLAILVAVMLAPGEPVPTPAIAPETATETAPAITPVIIPETAPGIAPGITPETASGSAPAMPPETPGTAPAAPVGMPEPTLPGSMPPAGIAGPPPVEPALPAAALVEASPVDVAPAE